MAKWGNNQFPIEEQEFAPPPSSFVARLISANGLDIAGFSGWEFAPGMRFRERAAWWRPRERVDLHEGTDLCRWRARDGRIFDLGAGTLVPAVWAGTLVAAAPDFLGTSLFFAHQAADRGGRRLHSVLGHVAPASGLAVGASVADGAVVATIAAAREGAAVAPHLHLTVALVAAGPAGSLDWTSLREASRATLLDPEPIVRWPR